MSGLTGFDVSGVDLSSIFQPLSDYIPYIVTNNTASIDITNDISNNLYNISIGKNFTSGTVTIQFLQSIPATVMLVGGGGLSLDGAGGGGGGGETLFFSYTFMKDRSYSFFLGSGGGNGIPSTSSSSTLTTPDFVYTANKGLAGTYYLDTNIIGGNGGGTNGGIGGNNSNGTNGTYANISNLYYSIGGGGGSSYYAGGGCSGYDYVVGTKSLPFPLTENDISSNIGVGGSTSGLQGGGSRYNYGLIGGGGGNGNNGVYGGGYGWCLITFDATALPQAPITNYKFFNTITGTTQDLNQIFRPLSEYTPYIVTNNTASIDIINDISNNLYNISIGKNFTSGTVTIQFLQSIPATVMLVGGGGLSLDGAGGGGGGGETLFFSYTFMKDRSYSFFLGSGGGNGIPSTSSSSTLTTPDFVYTANKGLAGTYYLDTNIIGGNGGGTNGGIGGNNSNGTNGTYANISNLYYSIGGGGGSSYYAGGGCSGYDYVVGTKSLPFPLTENDISSNTSVGGSTSGQQGGGVQNTSGLIGGGGGGGGGGGVTTDGGYGWCLITFDASVLPQAPITNYKFFNTITETTQDLNQIFVSFL